MLMEVEYRYQQYQLRQQIRDTLLSLSSRFQPKNVKTVLDKAYNTNPQEFDHITEKCYEEALISMKDAMIDALEKSGMKNLMITPPNVVDGSWRPSNDVNELIEPIIRDEKLNILSNYKYLYNENQAKIKIMCEEIQALQSNIDDLTCIVDKNLPQIDKNT